MGVIQSLPVGPHEHALEELHRAVRVGAVASGVADGDVGEHPAAALEYGGDEFVFEWYAVTLGLAASVYPLPDDFL
jgi:hypothetical protein